MHYAPVTEQYSFASQRIVDSEIQGQPTQTTILLRFLLSTSVTAEPDGLRAAMTIDSVLEAAGGGYLPGSAEQAVGTRFSAALARDGELREFAVDTGAESLLLDQIAGNVSQFFPRIPPEGLAPGSRWIDTTTTSRRAPGAEVTVDAVTSNEAGGWSGDAGARVLEVEWTRRYTFGGTGEQMGQAFTIDGAGTTVGRHRFGEDGRYVGSTSADSSSSTVTLTALGIEIPVTQAGTDTVSVRR